MSCSCVLGAIAFCRRVTSRSGSSAPWLFLRTLPNLISPSQLSQTNDLLFNSTFVDASKKITLCQTLSGVGHNTSSTLRRARLLNIFLGEVIRVLCGAFHFVAEERTSISEAV